MPEPEQTAPAPEQTASAPEQSPEQLLDTIYRHVAERMQNGATAAEVEKELLDMGLEAETAATIVANIKQAITKVKVDAGRKNMLYGALWCIGGLIVTVISYQAAEGGGKYVLAWGAILFGAIQFFRGLAQSTGD
jgi:hypothetical protein